MAVLDQVQSYRELSLYNSQIYIRSANFNLLTNIIAGFSGRAF